MRASEELELSDWANWVTQDKNGCITEWGEKPFIGPSEWFNSIPWGQMNEIECSVRQNHGWEYAIVEVAEWKPCMRDGILCFRPWNKKTHDELLQDYLARVWGSPDLGHEETDPMSKPSNWRKTLTPASSEEEDMVNNPSHYNEGEVECIDGIRSALGEEGFDAYCRGNAMKYIWRCNNKGNKLQDLQKAEWYLNKSMEVGNE